MPLSCNIPQSAEIVFIYGTIRGPLGANTQEADLKHFDKLNAK